jgi:hypothetical protein
LKIGKVYDWARGTDSKVRHEKTLVLQAARAHTGITSNGGRDTLAEVAEADHFDGKPIRLRTIAGILRLADELAEGPQRTTDFYRIHCGYEEGAVQFHEYAACTHVSADRASERIRLTYELQLNDFDLPADTGRLKDLAGFIDFITHRISKLDDERRYTRFYCPLLDVFKQTDVAINFAHGSAPLGYGVSFRLDDLVVPGHRAHTFDTRYPGKCETAIQVAENAVKAATEGAAL